MVSKGWRSVSLNEEVIMSIENHLKKSERGKHYRRSVPKFIVEAVQNQMAKEDEGI